MITQPFLRSVCPELEKEMTRESYGTDVATGCLLNMNKVMLLVFSHLACLLLPATCGAPPGNELPPLLPQTRPQANGNPPPSESRGFSWPLSAQT